MAELVARNPEQANAIFGQLHRVLGNRFVAEVMASEPETTAPVDTSTPTSLGDIGSTEEPELDLGSQVHADTAKQPPPPASVQDLAAADALVALPAAGTRGPNGTAAFMLAAIKAGFVTAFDMAKRQLQQFVDDKSPMIHSEEKAPYEKPKKDLERGEKTIEEAGKEKAAAKGLKISGTRGSYDVPIVESPILVTLVALVRERVQRWRSAGVAPRRVVLSMGNYVRGDPGYGGSRHTTGEAIDTAFIEKGGSSEQQAIAMVQDLPAAPRKAVFPDGDGVHINNEGDGYGFGFPMSFFSMPAIENAEAAKVAAEGSDHSKTLQVEGLLWGRTVVGRSTATWSDAGRWVWVRKETSRSAEPLLRSSKLKAALANMGKAKPTANP